MTRQLWEILAQAAPDSEAEPTCDKCWVVFQYLADEAVQGASLQSILQIARRHLANCAVCHEQHWQRLRELESRNASSKAATTRPAGTV